MIGLIALGSLAGLDRTAFGQTMLAEPLVASVLAGLLLGDPVTGLAIGIPLGLVSLPILPVGDPRPLDWTSAAVVAVGLAAHPSSEAAVGAALLFAVALAWVGCAAILGVRALAARVLGDPVELLARGGLASVRRRHFGFVLAHAVRGAAVVGLGLAVGASWMRVATSAASPELLALERFGATAPLLAMPAVVFAATRGVPRRWLVIGSALGLAGFALGRLG